MRSPYTTVSPSDIDESSEARPSDFNLEAYEKCPYCRTKLVFTHDLDLTYFEVMETARCTGCGVSLKPKKHSLQ